MQRRVVGAFVMLVGVGCPAPPQPGSTEDDAAATTEAADVMTSTSDGGSTTTTATTGLPHDDGSTGGTTQGALDDSGSTDTASEALTSSGSESGTGESNGYPQCRGPMGDCPRDHVCLMARGGRVCGASCNDSADCPVSPTGTAFPACTGVSTPMGIETYCALGCDGGETCPVGLTCSLQGLCLYTEP